MAGQPVVEMFDEWYDSNLPELLNEKNGVYHIAKLAFEAGARMANAITHSDEKARQHSGGVTANVAEPET